MVTANRCCLRTAQEDGTVLGSWQNIRKPNNSTDKIALSKPAQDTIIPAKNCDNLSSLQKYILYIYIVIKSYNDKCGIVNASILS